MRSLSVVVLASLLLVSAAGAASNYAPGSLDRYFTLEWQATTGPRGQVVYGYVHNRHAFYADRMRLSIEALDAAGRVVGSTTTWVLGGVPPDSRASFEARVPAAAAYRVEILSFDWLGRGGAGQ
jgi:hypothetical protein